MISFTGINESIRHIINNNKQKAATERIFNLLQKRHHYKDLYALDLEEEINTPVSSLMLCKNDKNSLLIGTSANILKKYHKPNDF